MRWPGATLAVLSQLLGEKAVDGVASADHFLPSTGEWLPDGNAWVEITHQTDASSDTVLSDSAQITFKVRRNPSRLAFRTRACSPFHSPFPERAPSLP